MVCLFRHVNMCNVTTVHAAELMMSLHVKCETQCKVSEYCSLYIIHTPTINSHTLKTPLTSSVSSINNPLPSTAHSAFARVSVSILSLLNFLGSIQPQETELTAGAENCTIAIIAYCQLHIHTWVELGCQGNEVHSVPSHYSQRSAYWCSPPLNAQLCQYRGHSSTVAQH